MNKIIHVPSVVVGLLGCASLFCSPSKTPPIPYDAAVVEVDSACTLLQGITQNQTVISICATVEEIALIASVVGPLLASESADGGACEPLPRTNVCATRLQIGRGIQIVLEKRRGLLLLDAGARDAS